MACGREFLSPSPDGDAGTRDCDDVNPCPLCKEIELLRTLVLLGLRLRKSADLSATTLATLWAAWESGAEKALR